MAWRSVSLYRRLSHNNLFLHFIKKNCWTFFPARSGDKSWEITCLKKIYNHVSCKVQILESYLFWAVRSTSLTLFLSSMLYTGILYNAVENSMQLQGIRYFVTCRNTTLNRFVFITIISPASMKTCEKFIIWNRKWNKQSKRGLPHPELLRAKLWSRCFRVDTWEVNYFTLKSLK